MDKNADTQKSTPTFYYTVGTYILCLTNQIINNISHGRLFEFFEIFINIVLIICMSAVVFECRNNILSNK
jgi:hypothetical protein